VENSSSSWKNNSFLAALTPEDIARWSPHLRVLDLPVGHVLVQAHKRPEHVWFPTTAIVSLIHHQANGSTVEVAVTGREGFVGVPVVTGGDLMPYQALTQTPGQIWQLPANLLRAEMTLGGPVAQRLLLFVQALFTQVSQTAVCNRHHALESQLCRWLLLMFDRLEDKRLLMTQEVIATMLGVRRETVTEAAYTLQKAGLIWYARGRIDLLNRPGLEARACECHAIVALEYQRLLGMKQVTPSHHKIVSRVS
jgi:CRP-like cAMP-binding protein